MKCDACVFVGESIYRKDLSLNDLLSQMKENGVDCAIVRPNKPYDYCYDAANQKLAAALAGLKNLVGFGRVNPLEKDAPAQIDRLAGYGLRGVHLHPWEDNFAINSPLVYPTIDACEKQALPVYVSTGYPNVSEPLQLWELAQAYPRVTFIATHGAQLDISGLSFDDSLYMAGALKNVKFDLSGVYRRDFIEKLIQTAGEENIVFGSCTPCMNMALEIKRIEAANISEHQKEQIFYSNIRALLPCVGSV